MGIFITDAFIGLQNGTTIYVAPDKSVGHWTLHLTRVLPSAFGMRTLETMTALEWTN